jgi:hypothetical protein
MPSHAVRDDVEAERKEFLVLGDNGAQREQSILIPLAHTSPIGHSANDGGTAPDAGFFGRRRARRGLFCLPEQSLK